MCAGLEVSAGAEAGTDAGPDAGMRVLVPPPRCMGVIRNGAFHAERRPVLAAGSPHFSRLLHTQAARNSRDIMRKDMPILTPNTVRVLSGEEFAEARAVGVHPSTL